MASRDIDTFAGSMLDIAVVFEALMVHCNVLEQQVIRISGRFVKRLVFN